MYKTFRHPIPYRHPDPPVTHPALPRHSRLFHNHVSPTAVLPRLLLQRTSRAGRLIHGPRILRVEAEPVRRRNAVVIAAAVLPVVGAVLLVPRLRVQAAISAVGDVVLAEEVRVEEVARVVGAVGARVAVVVRRVGRAGARAQQRVVHALEVLDADVGVFARRGQGRVDGAAELDGAGEAVDGVGRVLLRVAVGAGDDDVELLAVLALVRGRFSSHAGAPEGAFDVGEGRRVGASRGGVDGRVALKVDVEGGAEIGGVAELLAFDGVVGLEGVEAHVAVGVGRAVEVGEGEGVALGGLGVGRDGLEGCE